MHHGAECFWNSGVHSFKNVHDQESWVFFKRVCKHEKFAGMVKHSQVIHYIIRLNIYYIYIVNTFM